MGNSFTANGSQPATAVADRVRALDLRINPIAAKPAYEHVGALLADAVLQAGVRYTTVVVPRVRRILDCYPGGATTTGFLELIRSEGTTTVLRWQDPEKPARLFGLVSHLHAAGVQTVTDLSVWLTYAHNANALLQLRGIGPKTVDYLKQLAGISAVAVDRHLMSFVADAGEDATNYEEVRSIIESAALLLGVSPVELDRAIWQHQSKAADTQES